MLAAHRKDVSSLLKNKKDSGNLKDKEREIREKLVQKLKRKAEKAVTKAKSGGEGLESISDDDLSEDLEDVSEDEELGVSDSSEELSEIDSEEELRLTTTDEDGEGRSKRPRKESKRSRDKERDRERKQRELKRQISKAERIAARKSPPRKERKADLWEHEKYSRTTARRERTPTGYFGAADYYDRRRRSCERDEGGPEMDEFERNEVERRKFLNSTRLKKVNRFLSQQGMRKEQVEKEMERAYEKYFSSLARKEGGGGPSRAHRPLTEQEVKEEQWERMNNPHLFGGTGGGGFRKVKAGQHYEEVQKEVLQTEIRIRERRERMSERERPAPDDYRYSRASTSGGSRRERW